MLTPSDPSKLPPSKATLGILGESLVAEWLQTQGWTILEQRWQCRWGELDLVARSQTATGNDRPIAPTIAFVEVKTRSRNSWDANGLLALTPQKQAKLWKAAQLFLTDHPQWADLPCRFDVALVYSCRLQSGGRSLYQKQTSTGNWLVLQDYLADAFYLS
jgi:putative endonuclease